METNIGAEIEVLSIDATIDSTTHNPVQKCYGSLKLLVVVIS